MIDSKVRNRMLTQFSIITAFFMIPLCGCSSRSESSRVGFAERKAAEMAPDPVDAPSNGFAPLATMRPGDPFGESETPSSDLSDNIQLASNNTSTPSAQRIVIYTATLRMVVVEIDASIKQTEAIAAEYKGWVQSISGDSITIRVPADQYESAVAKIEALGRISDRQLQASDVTEEYVDLEARLKNALAVRDRLNALLAKAEDVKAALEVEKELARVGEEIERLQGKMELLKNRVAFSTISVNFERVYRSTQPPQITRVPFDWLNDLNPNRLLTVR